MKNIENLIEKQPNVKSLLLQIGEIAEQNEKHFFLGGGWFCVLLFIFYMQN